MKIIVIGGSAAGPKAAARARRINPKAEITIIQKEPHLSMASCGYPYYVGGFFDDRNQLISTPTGVVRDPAFFMKAKGITALTQTEATEIDTKNQVVTATSLEDGSVRQFPYDRLIIATGARPKMPPIPGITLEGITTLQSLKDADYLRAIRDQRSIRKAVVVGGGLIGVETAEALHLAGIEVVIVEMLPHILSFLNPQLASLVEQHLRSKGADVILDNGVQEFLGDSNKLRAVKLSNGTELSAELAVIAVGVQPNVDLARRAGIRIGDLGGIVVDQHMKTSVKNVFAVGDCIEVHNRLTGKPVLAPYGDLANLQGRVAGEHAATETAKANQPLPSFPGTVETGICKVFDFIAGSTGLTFDNAKAAGFNPICVVASGPDKPGFMKGLPLISYMVADRDSRRILGFQCVGTGDVSKQVAQAAVAIQGGLTVDDMTNLDLPYAPPFSLAIDNGIGVSHVLQNKMNNLFTGICAEELYNRVQAQEELFILDVRGPDEFEQMRLGIGERLIPLGALRNRLSELPQDKNSEIITFCKISLRGYEAARILQGEGYTNIKVLEGGILAWPYCREK